MAKYFLTLHRFSKSSDKYSFDLETPLLFPSVLGDEKHEYNYLEIKTNQNENELLSQY